jgi:hypothetical protein
MPFARTILLTRIDVFVEDDGVGGMDMTWLMLLFFMLIN